MKKIMKFMWVLWRWFTSKRPFAVKADLIEVMIQLGLVQQLVLSGEALNEQCVRGGFYTVMHTIRRVWLRKSDALTDLRTDESFWSGVLPHVKEVDLLFLFSVLCKYHEKFGTDDSKVGFVPSDETLVLFFHKRQDLLRKIVEFYERTDASPRYKVEAETWTERIAAFYVSLTLQAPNMVSYREILEQQLEIMYPVVVHFELEFWEQLGYWWNVSDPSDAAAAVRVSQVEFLKKLLGGEPPLGREKVGDFWEATTFDYPWDGFYRDAAKDLPGFRSVENWDTSVWMFKYPETIGRLYDEFKQKPDGMPAPEGLLEGVLDIIDQQPLESAFWTMQYLPEIGHYFGDNFDHHIPYNLEQLFWVMRLEPATCKAIPAWDTFTGAVRAIVTLSWEYAKETDRYAWMATTLTALPDEMLPEEAAQMT